MKNKFIKERTVRLSLFWLGSRKTVQQHSFIEKFKEKKNMRNLQNEEGTNRELASCLPNVKLRSIHQD